MHALASQSTHSLKNKHMSSAWHVLVSTLQDIVLYGNFKAQGATLQVSCIMQVGNVLQLLLWLRSGSTSAALASWPVQAAALHYCSSTAALLLQQYCCTGSTVTVI